MTSPAPGRTEGLAWRSRWIWSGPAPISITPTLDPTIDRDAARSCVLLRRSFRIDRVPTTVPARATADSRYVLWVNGSALGRGPVRDHPQRLHYDPYDLADHLRPGDNTLAVLARHYGEATPWWMPSVATFGLGGGAFCFEARVGDEWIVSDATWRCLRSDAWEHLAGSGLSDAPPEVLDARRLPARWTAPDFDDAGWQPAAELRANYVGFQNRHEPPSHPYGAMATRPVRQLGGVRRVGAPVAIGTTASVAEVLESPLADDPVVQSRTDQAAVAMWEVPHGALPITLSEAEPETGAEAVVLIIDLGQQTSGLVELALDAPAGTRVDVQLAEALRPDGRLEPLQQHSGFRYVARGSDDQFTTFDRYGFRFAALAVRGDGPVSLIAFDVTEQLSVLPTPSARADRAPDPTPHFRCSDPLLERVWAVGRRTVDLCSHDAYLDCPSREQRAWTGDFAVSQLVDFATNRDWSLARWQVELAALPRPDGMLPMAPASDFAYHDRTFIPDWALHWVHALWNLWWYTGDADALRRLLPVAERVLQWFEPFARDEGLVEHVTGWVIIDWSAVHTTGTSGALNALLARALREFGELAEAIGDAGRAAWAVSWHEQIRASFERLWDRDREVYVDHLVEGVARRPVSQHTNAAAIVAGLVAPERQSRLVDTITDPDRLVHASWLWPDHDATLAGVAGAGDMYRGSAYLVAGMPEPWWDVENGVVAAQPFFRYVVHEAVAVAGHADRIPAMVRDWAVLLERSPTTWTETWYGGSHCHAWCSTPTADLIRTTLGVRPAEPGFGRARVAPALGDLAYASAAIPTPKGLLTVEARPDSVRLETPIPALVVLAGRETTVAPGSHTVTSS